MSSTVLSREPTAQPFNDGGGDALPRCINCGGEIEPWEFAAYDPWDRLVHEECRSAAPWADVARYRLSLGADLFTWSPFPLPPPEER
jgi:hypothetical protein